MAQTQPIENMPQLEPYLLPIYQLRYLQQIHLLIIKLSQELQQKSKETQTPYNLQHQFLIICIHDLKLLYLIVVHKIYLTNDGPLHIRVAGGVRIYVITR